MWPVGDMRHVPRWTPIPESLAIWGGRDAVGVRNWVRNSLRWGKLRENGRFSHDVRRISPHRVVRGITAQQSR